MLRYFNDAINLARVASVSTVTEEWLLVVTPNYHLVTWAGGVREVTVITKNQYFIIIIIK